MAPIEIGYLTFCFFTSNSISLLNSINKLIALSLDDLAIVVCRLAPFPWLWRRTASSFPFIWSVFTLEPRYSIALGKQSASRRSSRWQCRQRSPCEKGAPGIGTGSRGSLFGLEELLSPLKVPTLGALPCGIWVNWSARSPCTDH